PTAHCRRARREQLLCSAVPSAARSTVDSDRHCSGRRGRPPFVYLRTFERFLKLLQSVVVRSFCADRDKAPDSAQQTANHDVVIFRSNWFVQLTNDRSQRSMRISTVCRIDCVIYPTQISSLSSVFNC